MSSPAALPEVGERQSWDVLTGYRLQQDRPWDCRTAACTCGKCNGTITSHSVTITGIEHYADNSIELVGIDDSGCVRRRQLTAPSGDLCY